MKQKVFNHVIRFQKDIYLSSMSIYQNPKEQMNCKNNKIQNLSNSEKSCDINELSDTKSEQYFNMMIHKGQQYEKIPAMFCPYYLFIKQKLERDCADKSESMSEEENQVREMLKQLGNNISEIVQIEDVSMPDRSFIGDMIERFSEEAIPQNISISLHIESHSLDEIQSQSLSQSVSFIRLPPHMVLLSQSSHNSFLLNEFQFQVPHEPHELLNPQFFYNNFPQPIPFRWPNQQDQSQMEHSSGWYSSRSTVKSDSDEQRQKRMIEKYFERNGLKVKMDLVLRKDLQDQQCPICYDNLITCGQEGNDLLEENKEISPQSDLEQQHSLVKLHCQHYFHDHCIKKWLVLNPKCPVCRRQYNDNSNKNLQDNSSEWLSQDIDGNFQQPFMMENLARRHVFKRHSSIIHEVQLISTLPKIRKLRKCSM